MAKFITPEYAGHFSLLVEVHAPHPGMKHLMQNTQTGLFPFQKLQRPGAFLRQFIPLFPLQIHSVIGIGKILQLIGARHRQRLIRGDQFDVLPDRARD